MSMHSAKLSELVAVGQLPSLVASLARLTGLPVCLRDRDGDLLASNPGPSGDGGRSAEGAAQTLTIPIEIAGASAATLVLGPYLCAGQRPEREAGRWPVLSQARVEVIEARARTLAQLLAELGLRTLELRQETEERGRAEEALLARELQYRSLVEQMNEGILAGDRETRITFVNSKMTTMLGYSEEEMLGRPFYEFMEPGIRDSYLDRIGRRHHGVSEKYELELIRKDGQRICTLVSAAPLRDAWSNVIGSFAVISDITEQKRSEQALRESEAKFRSLFESMQDVYYRGDASGRLVLTSPSGARLLGYDNVEELVGCDIAETMYSVSSDRQAFLAAIQEQGFVRDYEVVLRKRDGTPVIVSTNSRLNRDDQGRLTGVEGVFFDITERKKAEEALRQSEERYRLIVDNVQDILFTHLPDGTISFVSGGIRHLGYTPEGVTGHNLFEYVHPDDLELARRAFHKTQQTLEGTGIELRVLRQNGEYVWMEEQSDPVCQDGKLTQVTCVLRDITKRKSAEEALHRSENKYGWIINHIRDIIYSYFPDGTLTFVGESVRRMGYEARELVGQNLFDFMHPDDRTASRNVIDRAMREGRFEAFECRLRSKDGSYIWAEANSELVLLGGKLVQINGVARDITERKQAEEALRLSEEKYRKIVNNIQDIIYSYQPDGTLTFVSESVRRMGYEPQELVDHSIFGFLHPDDLPHVMRSFENAVLHNLHEHVECRLRTKGGGYIWFEENSEPTFQDGILLQVNAIARDISGRKAAEMALRESEEKYRWLVEQLNEGILVSDLEDVITFANPRMAEMLGYTVEELVGRKDTILLPEEAMPEYQQRAQRRFTGISDQYEVELIKKDGMKAHFLVSGTPLKNQAGEWVGSFGVLSDITEWKRAQEELKRLSTAIEQATDSIIISDTLGRILYANPASQTLTGLAHSALIDNSLSAFRSSKQPESFYRQIWATVRKGETWSGHLTNVRADGTRYETTTTMSPVRDATGFIRYVVTSSRDITREAELEVQLRHSQRMEAIGVMAGGIAHDFNNILTPVMGYTEMALNRPGLDAKVADYLREIASAGQRASELVQQILTFSRQTEQVKKPVPVDSIIKESLKLLRAGIPSSIAIRQRIGGLGVQTLADASQIHQVVMNLCTNAFHAMRETGGVLEVVLDALEVEAPLALLGATLPAGEYLRLRVSDNGRGMDEETRKKIFLPFFTTKRIGEGTGLGLSIVHGIVMGMGGGISVESEPGKGTSFLVYLPSVKRTPLTEAVLNPPAPKGSERILVVDDEGVIGAMLEDGLTFSGYEVEVTEFPAHALALVKQDPARFDLVITDLMMPEMTGSELARKLWEVRRDLPIVLMTGYTESLEEESAKEMGFAQLLRKPVSLSLIAQCVRAVLDGKPA
jgi:PAS domain S-box-containing protein